MEVLEKPTPKKSFRKVNSKGKGKSGVSRTESAPRNSVERLTKRPRLFSSCSVSLTNSFTNVSSIMDRVTKSWGYNVGPGELTGNDIDFEAKRRPRVYQDRERWKLLSATCVFFNFSYLCSYK